jgi:hypothetical protein
MHGQPPSQSAPTLTRLNSTSPYIPSDAEYDATKHELDLILRARYPNVLLVERATRQIVKFH